MPLRIPEFREGQAAGYVRRCEVREMFKNDPIRAARSMSPYRALALATDDSGLIEMDSDWQSGFVAQFCRMEAA